MEEPCEVPAPHPFCRRDATVTLGPPGPGHRGAPRGSEEDVLCKAGLRLPSSRKPRRALGTRSSMGVLRESPSTFCPHDSEQVVFSGDTPSLKMWFHSPRATRMPLWVTRVTHPLGSLAFKPNLALPLTSCGTFYPKCSRQPTPSLDLSRTPGTQPGLRSHLCPFSPGSCKTLWDQAAWVQILTL